MHSIQFHFVKSGLLMITPFLIGCSQDSPVGTWRSEADDESLVLRFFSDGSGDATDEDTPTHHEDAGTHQLTWRYEAGAYVLTLQSSGRELTATIREDDTLALNESDRPGRISVLRRSK